ncbi:callose synthase 11-like [Phragmites australis]|uniref:callose synthase 11-like n=1 Tax=Phragmites australis TaxID=29695 RepID=UPI002D78D7F8|nr:callose synthase 11-like [Phragmites australis]
MSLLRNRRAAAAAAAGGYPEPAAYNIIPIHDVVMHGEHPSLRFPEVRAAVEALAHAADLPTPPLARDWDAFRADLFDWLGATFGFQLHNVRNQREHLVLLLANAQLRAAGTLPTDHPADVLHHSVARGIRKKLLKNYTSWCSYLGQKPHIHVPSAGRRAVQGVGPDTRRDLLYTAMYLLIWGEAANLRFMPECLCYIFHYMALDLNHVIDQSIDVETGRPATPAVCGEDAFLEQVVTPIYNVLKAEVEFSQNGTKPHSAWRNYDDVNEYFWSRRVFRRLQWPLSPSRSFFVEPRKPGRIGKTGFVEQRSFWNVYRSFDRLWVMLILFFQAAMIVAWDGRTPWDSLSHRDIQVRVLSVFITWAGLRIVQALLDAGTQYSLVRRETTLLAVRMVLKGLVAVGWTITFIVLYVRMWDQRWRDRRWSFAANTRVLNYLEAAAVFVIPQVLALVLFIVPWIWNFLEKTNWRILYALTWWFQTRIFVGRGVREGLVDNIKYTTFWVCLLAAKFSFSYFLQIKPMVGPTKTLVGLHDIRRNWFEFMPHTERIAVILLWLPVVLIYLMDIQIWYAVFSSLTGALIGLFSHLGEIRSVEQLRLRFQFFASAMQFNLMPEEHLDAVHGGLRSKLYDAINRLKLRYGFGRPYRKIEANEVEAKRFALIWNEIIQTFREEDIISDKELELLELPPVVWKIRVVRWPCFLLNNELLLALSQATDLVADDRTHWIRICNNEYRRCAVVEAYDSIRHLLLEIIEERTVEHIIVNQLFLAFDAAMEYGKFTEEYKPILLPEIHSFVIMLVELLLKENKDETKIVNTLQTLYVLAIHDFPKNKKDMEQLRREGLAPSRPKESGLLFEDAIKCPGNDDVSFYKQVRRLHTILTSRDSMSNVPKNPEARRRITFFSNSLFMNIPRAPTVEKMMAFSVLTPYYNEDVMYNKDQLRRENEDGVSILFYLQKIYEDDWGNFLERMQREGMADDNEIWAGKFQELRLWASYRGQTLARTVRGMMYYHRALKMLAFLDTASEVDVTEGTKHLASFGSIRHENDVYPMNGGFQRKPQRRLDRGTSSVSQLFKGQEDGAALMKYTYVVACQIYGNQKNAKDQRADDILALMKKNEALRVAYVDEVHHQGYTQYYSVLVKFDQGLQREVEIYRVRLPGPLKLGEGKPENQNHAIIFTRGDAVQTIDMNQDNYFEEALKMRNLLEQYNYYHGSRKPTLLGVREHVFTGSVSSLAWFMSAQETSFVTLGQRVLANPLKVRMHYGHPDVFDRLWFLTRGGISKASRVINISEDIFAGFNCTLRGGNVSHHEYIQVGKGRDVGLNQISMFEAKVSSGNGEQTLSRDIYRLGHRLDFFRMLSVFYTTVGFYFNTMLVVLTVYTFVWGRLYLALSGLEAGIQGSANSTNNKALGTVLNQQFIIQLGFFTALPMIIENSLEQGFLHAIWDFFTMQMNFSSLFYTFSMGTKSHYYGRTILHGGAKYRATGRGFVVQHKSFAENYRLYARSHFIKAIELGIILTVYAAHSVIARNTLVYIIMNISSWFLVVSWIMAPFTFNPSGFDWLKTVYDFDDFMNWIWYPGGLFSKAEQSWEVWWYEEQDHLRTTGLWGKILEILLDLRYFFFQYGVVYQLKIANDSRSIAVYLLSWIFVAVIFGVFVLMSYARDKYAAKQHLYYRLVQCSVIILAVLVLIIFLKFTKFQIVDIFTSLLAFIPTGWGLISIAQVIRPFIESTVVWDSVLSVARLYEILLGVFVMAPVALLSWLPGFQEMQTRVLFNEGFSRGLQISRIISGKKTNTS